MKKIFKIALGLIILLPSYTSCDKDTAKDPYFEFYQDENKAPYVRIFLNASTVDSSILDSATIEGSLSTPANNVASYSLSVKLTGSMTTESIEVTNVTSFPSSFSISVVEIASALGIDIADIQPADAFVFSGKSTGFDGRVLTGDDIGPDLFGQPEQRQAYDFSVIVFCAPVPNPAGDWTLDMIDTWGDGWDGAFVTATIDGVGTDYTVNGTDAQHVVTVPEGSTLVWSYTSGSFECEHNFTMTGPDGTNYGPYDGCNTIPFCFFP